MRSYRSHRSFESGTGAGGMGPGWSHNHAVRIQQSGPSGVAGSAIKVQFGDGSARTFTWNVASGGWSPTNSADTLVQGQIGLVYQRPTDDSRWQFDASGKILSITQRNGWVTSYGYSNASTPATVAPVVGLLISVTNQFGRTLSLAYNAASQLDNVTASDGQSYRYRYDGTTSASRLISVVFPAAASKGYLYEDASHPYLLTGIVDESGNRLATYTYDAQGRGTSTQFAGGANRYTVSYGNTANGPVQVTDPLGTHRSYTYATNKGKLTVSSATLPQGTAHSDAASRVQNAAGLIDSETDFLGVKTTYTWDVNRRIPLTVTQAAGQLEAQTRSIQWHAAFKLPVLVTEAARTTAYSYDNLGNKLSESITDSTTGQTRTWAWSYNTQGLVETLSDPKGSIWRFGYDGQGNLVSNKNPLGHLASYGYDTAGRLISQTEPNGLLSTYAYDARGRLITQSRGAEVFSFSYNLTGQLASAGLPNGYQLSYQYDAAQRLISTSDNRGNSIQYSLDAMGNRVSQQVKDANGNIAMASSSVINSLNRVAAVQNASGQATQLGYDANGEAITSSSPLGQTTRQSLDALRRPIATTFADNAQARQAWSPQGTIAQVTDPKGVSTSLQSNAFGELVSQTSADSGALAYQRDANGQLIGLQDALGNTTLTERDSLGRVTHIQYDPQNIVALRYDSQQMGYLSQIDDKSGATTYQRDNQGRITSKTQTVNDNPANPSRYTVSYGYQGGQLASITYPSGLRVFYQRTAGRITGMDVQEPGKNKPVVPFITGLSHTAMGQPKSWAWHSGDSARREFDTNARMVRNEFASYTYDAVGRINALTQTLWAHKAASRTTPTADYQEPFSWSAGYDSRNRLVSLTRDASSSDFTYDANSNRLSATSKVTSDTDLDGVFEVDDYTQTTQQNVQVDPASNRQQGFTHTITKTQTGKKTSTTTSPIHYSLDANGAIIHDGAIGYEYDAAQRLSKVKLLKHGEAVAITYQHNALGQRVFKSEPARENYRPNASELGGDFFSWLQTNFGWLFTQGQASSSLGTAYMYADAELGSHSLLGEYGNGGASSKGRTEYLWLPTGEENSIPVGLYRNGKLWAVHSDHLGTPRLITNEDSKAVWQWPYSAFGDNPPTGILKLTTKPKDSVTAAPKLLKATPPAQEVNLRFAGQYFDEETLLSYNYFRSYNAAQGRFTQYDPIGRAGGPNPFLYAEGNALSYSDPLGLYTEIIVWGQAPGLTSSWGHMSGNINGRNYSFGPDGWDKTYRNAEDYANRQGSLDIDREGRGTILKLTPKQEGELAQCVNSFSNYHGGSNNCANPWLQCLNKGGVISPGNRPDIIPSDVWKIIDSSPNAIGQTRYPGHRPIYWSR